MTWIKGNECCPEVVTVFSHIDDIAQDCVPVTDDLDEFH